ncbi:MAG: very short patch repair endonuclease [Syntrophales bacterium]|nr:very short patch repair endonuclease [Syntrophales bacterium]
MDTFSPEKRSEIMSRVRSTDTTPEKKIRSILHKLGYRFRLHRHDLPGTPDIVFPKHRAVIFVHGCFWHRHQGCPHATTPASRQEYWLPKFGRTAARDGKNQKELRQLRWNVIVVWECETKDLVKLTSDLVRMIGHEEPSVWQPHPSSVAMAAEEQKDYHITKHKGRFSEK